MNATTRAAAAALLSLVWLAPGCLMKPRGEDPKAKRAYVEEMRQEALADLYKLDPDLKAKVRSAAGYATFSNLSTGIFLVSAGQGYGVAHDNKTGRDTYMRMAELGAGVGIGVRHFRGVFVFQSQETFRTFVDKGWQFGADVDAAAVAGGEYGAAAGASGTVGSGGAAAGGSSSAGAGSRAGGSGSSGSGIEVYELTDTGLALRGGVAGTKYWKDSELN